MLDERTPIDEAHAQMEQSDAARLRFFERVAEAELFLLLDAPPDGDQITPRIFPVENTRLVVAFDRETRLAEFAGSAPYVALSGRTLAQMLAGQEVALGLNLEVAPSSIILPAAALTWLSDTLETSPDAVDAIPEELLPPTALPEVLITGLDAKLALAVGLARYAYLCAVKYAGGAQSHMLAFIDPIPGSEPALAKAVNEALIFSGVEAGSLDVTFVKATDPIAARLAKTGLRFDLPQPGELQTPKPPGMDPSKPPKL